MGKGVGAVFLLGLACGAQAQVLAPVVELNFDPVREWRRGDTVTASWKIRRASDCTLASSVPDPAYALPAAPAADGSQVLVLNHAGQYSYRLSCDGNNDVYYIVDNGFRVTDGSEVGTQPPQNDSFFVFYSDVFVGNPGVPVADARFSVAVSGELRWSFPYAANCVASSGGKAALYTKWSGPVETRGSQRISYARPLGPLSEAYDYQITCSNAFGSFTRKVSPK